MNRFIFITIILTTLTGCPQEKKPPSPPPIKSYEARALQQQIQDMRNTLIYGGIIGGVTIVIALFFVMGALSNADKALKLAQKPPPKKKKPSHKHILALWYDDMSKEEFNKKHPNLCNKCRRIWVRIEKDGRDGPELHFFDIAVKLRIWRTKVSSFLNGQERYVEQGYVLANTVGKPLTTLSPRKTGQLVDWVKRQMKKEELKYKESERNTQLQNRIAQLSKKLQESNPSSSVALETERKKLNSFYLNAVEDLKSRYARSCNDNTDTDMEEMLEEAISDLTKIYSDKMTTLFNRFGKENNNE